MKMGSSMWILHFAKCLLSVKVWRSTMYWTLTASKIFNSIAFPEEVASSILRQLNLTFPPSAASETWLSGQILSIFRSLDPWLAAPANNFSIYTTVPPTQLQPYRPVGGNLNLGRPALQKKEPPEYNFCYNSARNRLRPGPLPTDLISTRK